MNMQSKQYTEYKGNTKDATIKIVKSFRESSFKEIKTLFYITLTYMQFLLLMERFTTHIWDSPPPSMMCQETTDRVSQYQIVVLCYKGEKSHGTLLTWAFPWAIGTFRAAPSNDTNTHTIWIFQQAPVEGNKKKNEEWQQRTRFPTMVTLKLSAFNLLSF